MNPFLRLVRVPNLLTVPGDPLAGLSLAVAAGWSQSEGACGAGATAWTAVVAATLASVAAYAGGMIDNDLVDLEHDRIERPERPLPSGAVGLPAARRMRVLLLLLPFLSGCAVGLPAAWFVVHVALSASILAYNRIKFHARAAGFVLMGLCRGLSVLSGAALLGCRIWRDRPVLAAAFTWIAYIAGVTAFASSENVQGPGRKRFLILLPFAIPMCMLSLPLLPSSAMILWNGALLLLVVAGSGLAAAALVDCGSHAAPRIVQRTVGRLIRVLLPMQACASLVSVASGGGWRVGLLLLCWIAAIPLSRRFPAS